MPSPTPRLPAYCATTLLHSHPEVWDAVFPLDPVRAPFALRQVKRAGPEVLDVR